MWFDCSDNSRTPRVLIDVTGPMFLVGRIYKCDFGNHYIRTTDSDLLKLCKHNKEVVFMHKSSTKRHFMQSLVSYVGKGLTFQQIQELIKNRTLFQLNMNKERYGLDVINESVPANKGHLHEAIDLVMKMLPKVNLLEDMFKSWFKQNESFYVKSKARLQSKILTVDHTFKVYNSFFV